MAAAKSAIAPIDVGLQAFVQEVTASLLQGKRHTTPGLGTFSTCHRKATPGRPASTMAIFRASAELREYSNGGPPPSGLGTHTEVVCRIVAAMQSEQGIDVPLLGRLAVVPVPGKRPKLIFHGARALNDALRHR